MRDEQFELLESLGVGGFAHTYRARVLDQDLIDDFGAEEVALKIPLNKKKERVLRRELEMNASLHLRMKEIESANLVRYLGFAVFDGQIVMAMEYVPQGSLRRVLGDIDRQKRLPVDSALAICEGVLKGLSVIHQAHVFHRDIKPENILMKGENPLISDFGISRMLESNELASTTTGTLFYMSPEMLCEEGATFSADIWSLGVTLYEMLTGRLPFGNLQTNPGTLIDLIRAGSVTPAHEVCPDVPEGVSKIVSKAMMKDLRKRYATPEDMLKAINGFRNKSSEDAVEHEIAAIRHQMDTTDCVEDVERKLKEIVKRHAEDARAYQCLGEFYSRCHTYGEAITAFLNGLERDPQNALLHWGLGLAYQNLGKRREAKQSIERALELDLDPGLQRYAALLLKKFKKDY